MMMTVESPAKEWENEEGVFEEASQEKAAKKWFSGFGKNKEGKPGKEKKRKEKPKKEKKVLTREQKKKRRKRLVIGGAAVVLLAVLVLPRLLAGPNLPSVTVAEAVTGDVVQTISGSGTVQSEVVTTYFSPVSATVAECELTVGDTVKAGDVLLTYDAEELDRIYQQADLTGDSGTYSYQDSITRDNENISEYNRSTHDIEILEQQVDDWTDSVDHLNNRVTEYSGKQAESAQTLAAKQEILAKVQQEQIAAQNALTSAEGSLKAVQEELENAPDDTDLIQKAADAKAAADTAKAALDTVNAQVKTAQADVEAEQNYLNEVNNKLSDYQSRLKSTSKELSEFTENLSKEKSIQASSDAAKLTGAARAQLETARDLSDLNTSVTKEQVEEGRRGIVAEHSGVVTSVMAVKGGPAAEGTALFTVASSEDVTVEMSITRFDLEKMEEGQKAVITLAGREYEGTVVKLSRLAEKNEKGTPVVKAQVKIDSPDENIYLGLEANVSVTGREVKHVLTVPIEAVNVGQDGSFCYVIENGVARKKIVETGLSSDTIVEILSGLQAGDQVVRRGAELIDDGMQVQTVEE